MPACVHDFPVRTAPQGNHPLTLVRAEQTCGSIYSVGLQGLVSLRPHETQITMKPGGQRLQPTDLPSETTEARAGPALTSGHSWRRDPPPCTASAPAGQLGGLPDYTPEPPCVPPYSWQMTTPWVSTRKGELRLPPHSPFPPNALLLPLSSHVGPPQLRSLLPWGPWPTA